MPWSKLKRDEVTVRRTKLLELRRQGIRFDDDRILSLGYSDAGAARKDLIRALENNRDEEAAEASAYRQQENERLDELLAAAWPRATQPSPVFDKEGNVVDHALDMRAVDTVLRLMDRRAKLNGLDMPVKSEITGANGGPLQMSQASDAELEAIMNAGPGPSPDNDDTPGQDSDSSG
ncbi:MULTISPECIES: hypothetical protein [Streptomyces rochei group]|uniref:hypothetical protein n=1 Tax=Streptomyces rochei group TaxID=2867164 RepID=UPI001873C56C|nr:hypothetical protein [Streptomyces vinaceusdrappus]GHC37529.1 hypothetical protein GCM10010308_65170 [Streptomyces vinaceusdrappus]